MTLRNCGIESNIKPPMDSKALIEKCCELLKRGLSISAAKLVYSKAKVNVSAGGVGTDQTQRISVLTTDMKENLPDIVTYLQNLTNHTRKTIV